MRGRIINLHVLDMATLMKFTYTLIGLLLFSLAIGQTSYSKKLWVGDADNYLRFDTDALRVEYLHTLKGSGYVTRAYKYFLIGDTLRVVEHHSTDGVNHDFLFTMPSTSELKLVPLHPNRLLAFKEVPPKVLYFRDQQKVYTDTINFGKLVFNTTACYGQCSAMSLQIDKTKQLKFIGNEYAVKQGPHTGILSPQMYNDLLKVLAVADLDKLENHGRFNIDLSTVTLEVHYNNKVKFIRSAIMPFAIHHLVDYLKNIPGQVELKAADKMEITFSQ
jgi:hypothetical protein